MNPEQDVRDVILAIAERLKNNYQPEKIILYGSFAYCVNGGQTFTFHRRGI